MAYSGWDPFSLFQMQLGQHAAQECMNHQTIKRVLHCVGLWHSVGKVDTYGFSVLVVFFFFFPQAALNICSLYWLYIICIPIPISTGLHSPRLDSDFLLLSLFLSPGVLCFWRSSSSPLKLFLPFFLTVIITWCYETLLQCETWRLRASQTE